MGVLQQCKLLLGKNFLLRWRHPGILLLEVVWPVLIVAVVALIRVGVPPSDHQTCHYQDRAMPSAGLVPFLQTFVCGLDNQCHTNDSKYQAEVNAGSVSSLVQQVTPYLGDEGTLDMLDNVEDGVTLIDTFNALVDDDGLVQEIDNVTQLSHYFRDPDKLKTLLVQDYNFSMDAVDALMDSQVNISAIMELSGYPDLKGVACDPDRLKMFLYFPEGTNATAVSESLCDINDSMIPQITDFLQNQLDVSEVIRLLGLFERLKARLTMDYTWAHGLADVADMVELALSFGDLTTTVKELMTIKSLPDIIRKIPVWVHQLQYSDSMVTLFGEFMTSMDPLVSEAFPNNTMWTSMKDGVTLGAQVTDMINGRGNVTSMEFMQTLTALLKDNEHTFNGFSPEARDWMNSITMVNWPLVINMLTHAGENNQTALKLGMEELQRVVEQSSLWGNVSNILPVANNILHSLNLLMDQTLEARDQLLHLKMGGGAMKQMLDQLLSRGPNVTLAVLKAFTHPDTLAMLLTDGWKYSASCADVIWAIRDDIGHTVADDLNKTLCYGDLSNGISSFLGDFNIKNISASLEKTLTSLVHMFTGNMTTVSVDTSLPTLVDEIQMMVHNMERMGNTTASSWMELFSLQDVLTDLVYNHSRDWEPVLDMLDENYLGSSVMSLVGAAGKLMNDSDSAEWMQDNIGPYVHMATITIKSVYDQMTVMQATYSRDSPMGRLVYYGTNYAPQLVSAVMDMDTDMVYKLAETNDPLSVLCENHMLQNMGLPHDVGVGVEEVVCLTNWTQMGINLMSTQNAYTTVVQDIMTTMDDMVKNNVTTSLEEDWRDLMYYTSRVMDMMMSSDDPNKKDNDLVQMMTNFAGAMNQGPWSLAMYANFSQMGKAFDVMMNHMQNFTMDDLYVVLNIARLRLEEYDQRMNATTPTTGDQYNEIREWRRLKHYFKMVEDASIVIMESYKQSSVTSLSEVIMPYPEEVKQMVNLAADAYLEFIDALKHIILKLDQYIHKLVAEGFPTPNCDNVTVASSYLMLAPSSSFARLEMQVCTANWTDISIKLQSSSQNQATVAAMEDLTAQVMDLDQLLLDPVVNWTQMLYNPVQALQTIMGQFTSSSMEQYSNFDLLPFNMTAINAKWSQFYTDMEQLENLDIASLSAAMQELQDMLFKEMFQNIPGNNELIHMLSSYNFINQHIAEFMNVQLRYMNSTSVVNVLDMLGSDELRKAAQVLRYSPEINQIGINTLYRMMTHPVQTYSMDLASLCTNQTLFRQVVAVNDSIISTPLLQQTVCNLNVNTTLLLQQLKENWDGFSELIDALELVMQPNATLTVNMTEYTAISMELSQLITSLGTHPPTFTFFDNDRWMNIALYEGPWKTFGEKLDKLYKKFQDPKALMGNMQAMMMAYLNSIAGEPEMQSTLAYMDVILDMIQSYSASFGSIPTSIDSYPNMKTLYSLLNHLPELFEMVGYTIQQDSQKLSNWVSAMTSWDTFCGTDPTTLMTAPSDGGLDVRNVFSQLCSINITQLGEEFNDYQGFNKLNDLLAGGNATGPVNVTALAEKFETVMTELENLNFTSIGMNSDWRFLNESIWYAVFMRLGQDNGTEDKFTSPEFWLQMLQNTSTLFPEFAGFQGTIEQMLALSDIILDQVLQAMQGSSLQEVFANHPSLEGAVTLMNSLPEIYETMAYTGLYSPEKILEHWGQLMSLESFCSSDITLLLTVPPQSGYDPTAWQRTLCSINVTDMLTELGFTRVQNMFMPNASISLNVTSISEKLTKVTNEFTKIMSGNSTTFNIDNYFNVTAWEGVMQHLQTWMQDSSQLWTSASFYKRMMSAAVLSSLQAAIPEMNTALRYTSAILDVFEQQLERSTTSLSAAFAGYPNMETMLSLLEDTPEIFEIFAYTTLQRPEQLARWSPAMASWETFCSNDPDSLLTAPPGSRVTVTSAMQRLCSINVTELMTELNQYQGMDRLQAVLSGNTTEAVNVTAVAEQMSSLIDSMSTLFSSPEQSGYNLRLFNQTVWEQVFQRLGQNLNDTQQQFMSPATLMDFYTKLFAGYSELNDTEQTMNKVWAVTDIVLDQMLRSLQGGNLQVLFSQYPSMQSMVGLLDYLPEIYETVMYTALYAPDKVVARVEAFSSLEALCTSDMTAMFTVPDGVDFNLTAWQIQFCSLNLTQLMTELAQYQGTQDIANIFSPDSTVTVNMTSVVEKIQTVVGKLASLTTNTTDWMTVNARFLNTSLWELANSNLQNWLSNASDIFWMRTDKVMLLYADMLKDSNVSEALGFMQPVYAVMELLMDKLFLYENMTSLTLDELFIGAPEMQKLVQLLQEPGVIEVLLESANSEKFAPLLSTNNVTATFVMLCSPTVSLDQYLTVPAGVTIDLVSLKTRLCSIDLQSLPQEVMNFFDVERFAAAVNGSLAVDYVALSQQYNRLSALIERWTRSPPVISLPAAWQNESFWLGILERYGSARQDTDTILQELERFVDSLGTLMTDDPMRQVALVAQTIVRLLDENVVALQSQNLTMENLVLRVPILLDVYSALGIEGDILDSILKAPVQSAQFVLQALLANGTSAQHTVCNMTRLQELMKLPATFNTTALYQGACLKNTTEAVNNLVRNLDLQGLIDGLQSPLTPANWSQVFRQSEELQKHIEALIAHPPTFNASSLMALLNSTFNTSNLWQLASMYSYQEFFGLLDAYPEMKVLKEMVRVQGVVVEFLDDLMSRLVVNGATVDLASLFSSSPSFVRLMDAALHAQPNPVTALAFVQLNPARSSELMTLDEDRLQSIMCTPSEFQKYFIIPAHANITEILGVLCSLNFTQFVEELNDNFMVDALSKKFATAMNDSSQFSLQKYINMSMSLVEQFTALAGMRNVTFNGNDLGHVFDVNITQLVEAMESVNARMQAEYPALLTSSLNSVLAGLINSSEGQGIVIALKAVEMYLHDLNRMLEDISSGPISLAAILNNTEVGNIVIPFLQNPQSLQDLLDLQLLPHKLNSLLMSGNMTEIAEALCGPQLFTAFAPPGNDSAVLRQLQTSVCGTNTTVMLWQAMLGQASGYQFYLQMQVLLEEVTAGRASVNVSAIDSDVKNIIALLTQIVLEYQNGTRSTDDFLDWRTFGDIFDRFSTSLGQKLMNISQQWSADMTQALMAALPSDSMAVNARTINTINIFMNIINDRLDDMLKNGVSLYTLLNHSSSLVSLMEAYLEVTRLSPLAWLDSQFNVSRLMEVVMNTTMLNDMCASGSLASYLADGAPTTTVVSSMQTVMCSVTTELPAAFRQFIDYEALQMQIETLWNMSVPVEPQYKQYADNIARFNQLITQLAQTPPTVDPGLSSAFDFTNMMDALENIATNPEIIFRLLRALGIVIDGPMATNDQQNIYYGINAYIAQPLLSLVHSLDQAGLSFSRVIQDPSALVEALPVLMNFDLQFDLLASTYIQPTMNKFWNNENFRNRHLCNGQLPAEVTTLTGVTPSTVSTLCTIPTTDWIHTMKTMNYTEAQILSWVNRVEVVYSSAPVCYTEIDVATGQQITACSSNNADLLDNKGMYWMRLMSTLESVVSLLFPDDDKDSSVSVADSLTRIVDIMRDAFLNQTLQSAMNYLEAVDRMGTRTEDWLMFKQIMSFLQTAGSLLNDRLHSMTDSSGTVTLQNLLPDSEKLANLLQKILGPASASEMLASSVSPQLFYYLSSMDQLQTVACDPVKFSTTFVFPAGANVTAIQMELCDAATTRSTGVQELVDLFQAGDVLVQLDHLVRANYSSVASDMGVWQALSSTVSDLMATLEMIQTGHFDMTVSQSWLNPVLQQLNNLNQMSADESEALCRNYVVMLEGTMMFQAGERDLVLISRVMNVVTKALPLLAKIDELVCTMVTEDGLDVAGAVNYLRQDGLDALVHAMSELMINGTEGRFQCQQLTGATTDMVQWVTNLTQSPMTFDMTRLAQCLEQGSPLFVDVLHGFNQMYQVMTDVSSLLTNNDIKTLLGNSGELSQILDFMFNVFSGEKSVVLKFGDLLANSTDVQSYLTAVIKLAPEAVNSFLASTINLNSTNFLNHTVSEIADTLCDPTLLADVIDLPDFSPFNLSTVSDLFCTANVNVTAAVFKDASKSAEFVAQLTALVVPDPTGQFVSNLTNNLMDLVSQLQSVSFLLEMMGNNAFDVNFLMQNADTIDAILAGGGTIQKIVDSLNALVGSLKYMVPEEDHYIITDVQTFISGLQGLDLIQSYLVQAIRVSDLQEDPAAVRQFLIGELGFTPDAASAILASTYSVRLFLNASGLMTTDEPCDEKLPQFILMNTTQHLEDEVIHRFCNLSETEVTNFMEVMVPQLDIGTLVQKYITYSGQGFLDAINMTKAKVQVVFQSLSDGSQALGQTAVYLLADDSSFSALVSSLDQSSQGGFDAMKGLQPALCGQSQPEVSDQFNLDSKVQGARSAQDLAEEAQISGEFCKGLYRSITSSNMGSVIWTFVKPLMSGKILFTPDTPLTRQIISNANWVFDTLSEVKRVSKKWSEKVPSLVALSDTASRMSSLQDTLNNGFIQSILQSTLGMNPTELTNSLKALGNSTMNATDIATLQRVAELVYNYTSCMDLARFEAVASEEELERKAFQLYNNNTFLAGIVFTNMETNVTVGRRKRQANNNNNNNNGQTMPKHVIYKIRMDIENTPTTNRIKDRLWIPYARDDFASQMRYLRGFVQLQDMVESAILRLQTGNSYNSTGVTMQQMPFPCHTTDDYIHYLGSYLLPILMTFAWLAAIGIATHNLVYDRQSGQEESLRIMGMVSGLNVLAWFLVTLLFMAVVAVIITTIFKYAGIFQHSNWLILFLFILDFAFSTIAMCYLISAFFSRVTLAILSVLIIYFLTFLPYIVLISAEVYMTMWQKSLACLSSTTAFSFGAIFITRFEEEGEGLQWSNVNDNLDDSVDFAWMCYMMLIDSAIYLLLGWYIRNVKPGKYGIKQPWYFPVSPSYWCSCLSKSTKLQPPPQDADTQGLFEPAPHGLDIGISVRGLRKTFSGGNEVVHGVDVDIFHDQITTLLGHNGAAKTTTLSMLVGVLNPSGGVVLVEGKKTQGRTGLLGLCPQHNILFEFMTVKEHMEFYGGVKGNLSHLELQREIRKLLHDVDLWHLKDVQATDLSGGMQRRLCIALAFVGGARTIVLDEPTSGVDPHARKNIWNLILKNRPGRTILMSTHHLDEADMLSDRILIMHHGRLLSVGSPAFLKNHLGGGYKLTLHTNPSLDVKNEHGASNSSGSTLDLSEQHSRVMSFIQASLPTAKFVESVCSDLTVSIAYRANDSAILAQFFRQLEAQKMELGVMSYGISNTTLEEVFLKLTSKADDQYSNNGSDAASTDVESVSTDSDNTILRPSSGRPKRSVKGASLKFQQLGALLLKRVHHYRRNWRMCISTLLLPLLAFLCAMGFSTIRPTQDSMSNLIMSPALYAIDKPVSYAFVKDNINSFASNHFTDTLLADPGIGTTCMEGFNPGKDFKCVTPGMTEPSTKKEQVCHCNDYKYMCEDSSQSEGVDQTLTRPDITLQNLALKDVDHYLVDSYMNYIDQRFGGWSLEPPSDNSSMVKVWFNNKGYHAIPSYFNALSNNLLRSGISSSEAHKYGITLYNHPLMLNSEQLSGESIEAGATDVGIAMVILLALTFIPSAFMVYMTNEQISQERHLQSISGVGTVLYWSASFLWDLMVYSITLGIMVVIVVIFQSEAFYDRNNLGAFALLVFLYGWAVIPLMYCTLRAFRSGSSAYLTLFCTSMLLGLLPTLVLFALDLTDYDQDVKDTENVLRYVFLIFPPYSLGKGLVSLATNQFQYKILKRFGEDTYVDPFDFDMLGWHFVALGVQGLLFFLLTFFIHSRKERAISMTSNMHYSASKNDEDVFHEQERVRSGGNGDSLAVKDICKVYRRGLKRFCAVNHLSFGVNKGECFGLLGVNGAGKTTTFKMLTGATTPSEGDAIIQGRQLSTLRSHLGDEMGYCPQEDALDHFLSGKETLEFHAKLRGFGSDQMKAVVSEQLRRLHLDNLADKAVHTYSGGNKRKLALAVAMLGDPPLLLLDEPTTGMDAATRRLAWKCITMATQRGQSVLLTSHSMDECDTLCSRLAIMVNGQLKCIGSPQHLKDKFGDGYTVVLHLQGLSTSCHNLAESFLAHFPGSVIKVSLKLKDQHHSVIEVSIPRGAGTVADIFSAVQRSQTEHHIMYYSVSQTTLDTVFVNFAREQSDDSEHDSDMDTSSGGSGSSTSGEATTDSSFQKSMIGNTYAYMNPEYASGPLQSFEPPSPAKMPPVGVMAFDNNAYDDELFVTKL